MSVTSEGASRSSRQRRIPVPAALAQASMCAHSRANSSGRVAGAQRHECETFHGFCNRHTVGQLQEIFCAA